MSHEVAISQLRQIEHHPERSNETDYHALSDLVDPQVLKRSGLDNPHSFTLENGKDVPTHFYIGANVRGFRVVVSEVRKKEVLTSGRTLEQVWRATSIRDSVYANEEEREKVLRRFMESRNIRMSNEQIGGLVDLLVPRPRAHPSSHLTEVKIGE